jgi:hypothetical protein
LRVDIERERKIYVLIFSDKTPGCGFIEAELPDLCTGISGIKFCSRKSPCNLCSGSETF